MKRSEENNKLRLIHILESMEDIILESKEINLKIIENHAIIRMGFIKLIEVIEY